MNIISGFNLFVRQALLYPLASPFLPAVADVKKDVSYANGALIGTLEAGGGELVWQSVFTFTGTWNNAILYAQYLEADGVTVAGIPQNIWRLPKLGELLNALSQQFIEGGTKGPGSFVDGTSYWSGIEYASIPVDAWSAFYYSMFGYVDNSSGLKSNEYSVRCVKI